MISLCARYRVKKFSIARKIKAFRSCALSCYKTLFLFGFSRLFQHLPRSFLCPILYDSFFVQTFVNFLFVRIFAHFPHFLPRVYRVYKFPYISENATICNYPPCAYIVFTNSPYLDSFNIFYQSIFPTIRENRYKNLYSPVTFQAVQHLHFPACVLVRVTVRVKCL